MTPACSPLEARQLDLAERVMATQGYVVVSTFIAMLISRLEADPTAITDDELQAIRYCIATSPGHNREGHQNRQNDFGERTGWGGLREYGAPPFFPHQRNQ